MVGGRENYPFLNSAFSITKVYSQREEENILPESSQTLGKSKYSTPPPSSFPVSPKGDGELRNIWEDQVQGHSKGLKFNEIIKQCSSPYLINLSQLFYFALGKQQRKIVFVELHITQQSLSYINYLKILYVRKRVLEKSNFCEFYIANKKLGQVYNLIFLWLWG